MRFKKLFQHAQIMLRKNIEAKYVASIMVGILEMETAVLISWKLVGSIQWHHKVLTRNGEV